MEVTTNNAPVKVEANNGSERPTKKNGKEEKSRRKDDKSVEQVMKALNVLETTEEKLAAMCKKYTEIVDENRKLQVSAKQWEKGLHAVLREKEQLQTDHSKAVLTRSRLESLCRELQRQNKQIKEESLLKIREEEEKRKEVSAKFNSTLAEITSLMTSSNEKTNMLRDENVEITKKFKSICDQNAIQQQQVDKMNTQRKLESELTEARLAKQRLEFTAEKEILLKEKQELFMDIHTLHARVNELEASEASLKGQVSLYADRYDEFQTALTKSNEVFGGFKGEMEKMSKKITRLEKETSTWKSRWEKSHQSFLEVVAEKSKCEGELALASRKHTQLEKLCRTLQTERVMLLTQIKGLSLVPPSEDNGTVEAGSACIESSSTTSERAPTHQTCCSSISDVDATPEGLHECSKELTVAIESLNVQSSSNDDLEKSHSNTPDVANIAQPPVLDIMKLDVTEKNPFGDVALEKSPVFSFGVSSNNQDEVNALTVDRAPADHVEGGSNPSDAASRRDAGKTPGDKQGSKVEARAANKKGVKSRTGVKEMQGDKKSKPSPSSNVKKDGSDASKEKKDKDNVRVLTGIKGNPEAPIDKKDKNNKELTEKKDESAKEKKEMDYSNAKQRHGNVDEVDSNKIAEFISEEKKNETKVQEVGDNSALTRTQEHENRISEGSTNPIPLSGDANEDATVIPETKLIKDLNVALASPSIEKKGPDQVTNANNPPDKELKKTGGEQNKMPAEKQVVQITDDVAKKMVELLGKENDSKKEVEMTNTAVIGEKTTGVGKIECEINSLQPFVGVELTKESEGNEAIINSLREGKKEECKFGERTYAKVSAENLGAGKKVENVADSSKPSLPSTESHEKSGKDIATKAVNVCEDKVLTVSEPTVAPKTPDVGGIGQVKPARKPSPAPYKEVRRTKKPEKVEKAKKPAEKSPLAAEQKVDETPTETNKPSVLDLPTENDQTENRCPSDPTQHPALTPGPESPASTGTSPATPEATTAATSSPSATQEPETGSPSSPNTRTEASEVNPGAKQQSDVKREKVVAKKRKK